VPRLVLCYQSAVAMRVGAQLARAKFTLLPRSGSAGRAANSEYLLWDEFFCHTNLHLQKVGHQGPGAIWTVYALLITDIGRFCRKALISALFICKPPL
jgi:hypothetical protein